MAKGKAKLAAIALTGLLVLKAFQDKNDPDKKYKPGDTIDVSDFDDARIKSLVDRGLVEAPQEEDPTKDADAAAGAAGSDAKGAAGADAKGGDPNQQTGGTTNQ